MTIHTIHYMVCTQCGKQFGNSMEEVAELKSEIRTWVKNNGWHYVKVQNGSYWDFCPECYKNYQAGKIYALNKP